MPSYDAALVFAREDLPIAKNIVQALGRWGLRVWADLGLDDLVTERVLKDRQAAFSESRFVVPLLSPQAATSEFVLAELRLAIAMNARVLPCLIAGPDDLHVEDDVVASSLRRGDFIDLRSRDAWIPDEQLAVLAERLREYLPPSAPMASPPHPSSSGNGFLWPTLALIALLLLVAGLQWKAPDLPSLTIDPRPAAMVAGTVLVWCGAVICVTAVCLWTLRQVLEHIAVRRMWRHVRSSLGDSTDAL